MRRSGHAAAPEPASVTCRTHACFPSWRGRPAHLEGPEELGRRDREMLRLQQLRQRHKHRARLHCAVAVRDAVALQRLPAKRQPRACASRAPPSPADRGTAAYPCFLSDAILRFLSDAILRLLIAAKGVHAASCDSMSACCGRAATAAQWRPPTRTAGLGRRRGRSQRSSARVPARCQPPHRQTPRPAPGRDAAPQGEPDTRVSTRAARLDLGAGGPRVAEAT